MPKECEKQREGRVRDRTLPSRTRFASPSPTQNGLQTEGVKNCKKTARFEAAPTVVRKGALSGTSTAVNGHSNHRSCGQSESNPRPGSRAIPSRSTSKTTAGERDVLPIFRSAGEWFSASVPLNSIDQIPDSDRHVGWSGHYQVPVGPITTATTQTQRRNVSSQFDGVSSNARHQAAREGRKP